jgi:hypothetical protein
MTFAHTFHPITMWIMVSAMLLLSMRHCLVIASSSDVWSATCMDSLAFVIAGLWNELLLHRK